MAYPNYKTIVPPAAQEEPKPLSEPPRGSAAYWLQLYRTGAASDMDVMQMFYSRYVVAGESPRKVCEELGLKPDFHKSVAFYAYHQYVKEQEMMLDALTSKLGKGFPRGLKVLMDTGLYAELQTLASDYSKASSPKHVDFINKKMEFIESMLDVYAKANAVAAKSDTVEDMIDAGYTGIVVKFVRDTSDIPEPEFAEASVVRPEEEQKLLS